MSLINVSRNLVVQPSQQLAAWIAQALAALVLPDLKKELDMQLTELVAQYKSALETVTAAANAGAAKIQSLTSDNQNLASELATVKAQLAQAGAATDQEATDAANDVNAANQASAAVNALVNPPAPAPAEQPAA